MQNALLDLHHGPPAGLESEEVTEEDVCQESTVGKRFRFALNRKEVVIRLAERFKCRCVVEDAAFNNVNWTETERYTRTFARYFVRFLRSDAGCSRDDEVKRKSLLSRFEVSLREASNVECRRN